MKIKYFFILLVLSTFSFSQNEANKWFFGNGAGLDFNTNPPTAITASTMSTIYSSASMSDPVGNLLFYTNGINVWNSTHAIMANGTGLAVNTNYPQNSIIVKQPGSSTLYYVIYTQWMACSTCTSALYYSIVDMSLASGQGSVTIKNAIVYSTSTSTLTTGTKITATRHCNGVDIWLLTKESNWNTVTTGSYTPNFRAYLLTSTGINTTAVVSPASTYTWNGGFYDYWGNIKFSPNGKKVGCAVYNNNSINNNNNNNFELYDFDNTTGVVSNSLALFTNTTTNFWGGTACEFSPDGSKFYGARYNGSVLNNHIYQWDLCAGSPTAVVASIYTVTTAAPYFGCGLQVASNGKIYYPSYGTGSLEVINNPNLLGAACGYTPAGQSIAPKNSWYGLPNFMTSYFTQHPPATPFTYTVSNTYGCQAALFNSTYNPSITAVGCVASGYSLTGLQWNFGDPTSGINNTSSLTSPIHAFTTLGTYSVNLVLYYSCGGGTDTIKQVVNINQPCISVASSSITCANLGSATVAATGGIGPFSYTWMPSAQAGSVATGLSPGTYTLTVYDFGTNFTYTATTLFTSLIPLTGNLSNASSIACNGASTATANVTGIAGGSGSQNYLWFNTTTSYTTPTPLLSAGLWSLTVTDAITGCQINQSFYITQPPAMNLVLSSNTPTTCAGTTASLSGINSGGTPYLIGSGFTYSWTGGPSTNTRTVSQTLASSYVYTLTSKDSLNCATTKTIGVDFVQNPVLSVSSVSICPLETGTLSISGASTYTWTSTALSLVGNTFTDNPLITKQYTVVGSALSCTSAATASIILKPLPTPLLNSNSPICNGQNLNLFAGGGATYVWSGPLGYSSFLQYPVLSGAIPNNSGVYNLTVTAANNCTASITKTITVNLTPTLSALGSTVCVNQTLNLSANSFPGATFLWLGPGSYSSTLQNPFVPSPSVSASGIYTVKATSTAGCTNTAIVDVTVTAMPVPTITSTSPKCFGTPLNFTGSGGVSYLWTGPNGFNSALQNPSIAYVTLPAAGLYNLQITTGPCVNNTTHSVTIYALPAFTISSNSPVCETKSLSLAVTNVPNVASYLWHGPASFGNQYQLTGRDSSILSYSGIYTLTVIDNNTCQNTNTIAVSINQNPTLSPVSATVCLNEPATLKVSGATTYIWSGPNFYYSNQPNALIKKATSPVATIYTVVGTAANSCTAIVNATLSTLSLPLPALSIAPNTKVCLNSKISLEGFGGATYEWKGPGGADYGGKVLTFTASSMAYAGTYTLAVTDAKGCTDYTTTTLSLDLLPDGDLSGTTMEACVPFRSDFSFRPSFLSSSFIKTQWQINNEAPLNTKNFFLDFKIAGDYSIHGTYIDTLTNCMNTATFVVHARPIPVADFSYLPEKPVEGLDEVIFTNNSSGPELTKWNWYFITNSGKVSTQQNSSYFFVDAGIYPVAMIVKNTWGCADSIVKAVTVAPDFNVFVPNVFTPNGDNENDLFLPISTGVKFYDLTVFDRWGKRVFQTFDLKTGWDGKFNGEGCQNEVYVWKIKVSSLSGEMKELNGYVTLYR